VIVPFCSSPIVAVAKPNRASVVYCVFCGKPSAIS